MTLFLGHEIEELDRRGFRQFGVTLGVTLNLILVFVLPWLRGTESSLWFWLPGMVLLLLSFLAPQALRLVHAFWMRLAIVLNRIMNPIIMGIIFFLFIFPFSLVLRLIGKELLKLDLDDSSESYREEVTTRPKEHMSKPY